MAEFTRYQSGELQSTLDDMLDPANDWGKEDVLQAYIAFRDYHKEQPWAQAMVGNYRRSVAKVLGENQVTWEAPSE